MNTLVPMSRDVPAHPMQQQFRPIEPERMHLRQLFGILLQRAKLGLGVAALVFLLVLAGFAMQTRMYGASGSVVIDPKGLNLARPEQQPSYGAPPDTSAVDTQVEVLRSHALAERVTRRLKLWNDPEFNPAMAPGFFGLVPARAPIADPTPQLVSRIADRVMGRSF